MADLCVSCNLVVRPRQEALQCDSCHRTCGTTVSRDFYTCLVKKEVTLEKFVSWGDLSHGVSCLEKYGVSCFMG